MLKYYCNIIHYYNYMQDFLLTKVKGQKIKRKMAKKKQNVASQIQTLIVHVSTIAQCTV